MYLRILRIVCMCCIFGVSLITRAKVCITYTYVPIHIYRESSCIKRISSSNERTNERTSVWDRNGAFNFQVRARMVLNKFHGSLVDELIIRR